MGKTVRVDAKVGDITSFEADVVSVKYAEGLFSSALELAAALGKKEEDFAEPLSSVGSSQLLSGAGKIKARKALFLSVVSLTRFDYVDVERFAFEVLDALSSLATETRHLALTLHGTGLGLGPSQVLRSLIRGISEAIQDGAYPPNLERITIIDLDDDIIARLNSTLFEVLPALEIEKPGATDPSIPVHSRKTGGYVHSADGFDVFVSYKTADIVHARRVCELLVSNGLTVFFSRESLMRLGRDEYAKQIDLAIENSRHMVVVTSSGDNVRGGWVEHEWSSFLQEKHDRRKTGNLIPVITRDMSYVELPLSLRHREVIQLVPGELERLLEYVWTETSGGQDPEAAVLRPRSPESVDGRVDHSGGFSDPHNFVKMTGFVLSKTEVLEEASWLEAREHARSLSIAGSRGWKLPSIEQLRLIRTESLFPEEFCYWSRKEAGPDEAFYVHYDDGHVGMGPKTFGNGLCAVFIHEE